MSNRLTGKVAVVTGGNSGIGLATAKLFVEEGATVIITGRRQKELDQAVASVGGTIEGVRGDISKLADIDRLRAHIAARHGRVDVLFANAGTGSVAPLGHVTEEDFDQTVATNLKGTFFTVQALLPLIPSGGSIILNSSMAANKGFPNMSVYSATKAGLRSFARTWTTDLSDRRIRVNTLTPGTIVTPIFAAAGLSDEQTQAYLDFEAARTPLGRNGLPSEIAAAVLFLASNDSSFVTGTELTVDGGTAQV